MLDNGYVYPAATRLTVFRSPDDWAMTIEVFGFSPRTGLPDTHIYTFAGELQNRQTAENFVNRAAYELYLANNPHNESRFIYPIAEGDWLDEENVSKNATEVTVRGEPLPLPSMAEFKRLGIELKDEEEIRVFELCRYLADIRRSEVLATAEELRVNVCPRLEQILQLDEWNHPDVVDDSCRPSGSEAFQQLSQVIVAGNARLYRPSLPPNTHWRNWPEGGTL